MQTERLTKRHDVLRQSTSSITSVLSEIASRVTSVCTAQKTNSPLAKTSLCHACIADPSATSDRRLNESEMLQSRMVRARLCCAMFKFIPTEIDRRLKITCMGQRSGLLAISAETLRSFTYPTTDHTT